MELVERINSQTGKPYKVLLVDRAELIMNPLWFHTMHLMQTTTGYGKNLKTEFMIKYNNRLCRVYYSNFSNAGTHYIKTKQGDIILNISF